MSWAFLATKEGPLLALKDRLKRGPITRQVYDSGFDFGLRLWFIRRSLDVVSRVRWTGRTDFSIEHGAQDLKP